MKQYLIQINQDFNKVFQDFLVACDVSQDSKKTYERNLKQFFSWCLENGSGAQANKNLILEFKQYLIAKDLSPYSISNYLGSLKLFFQWTEEIGLYPNITKSIKIKLPKVSAMSRRQALDLTQAKELLNEIDPSHLDGLRDFAIINLMLHNGLRSIEVIRSNMEDLQKLEGQDILWVQGKGHRQKDDYVVLLAECLKPIKNYIEMSQKEGVTLPEKSAKQPLFCSHSNRNKGGRLTTRSVRRIVKKHLRNIDLDDPRISCHSLRHTAVTLALKGGADIRHAQQMARHKSVKTTERYAHDLDKLEAPAEKVVEELLKPA